jgi:predicted nucleic acid-binding protein
VRWVILDTTVYIGHWERRLYEERLAALRKANLIRYSAVVLSELRRGARIREAQRLAEGLYRLAAVRWEPTIGGKQAD